MEPYVNVNIKTDIHLYFAYTVFDVLVILLLRKPLEIISVNIAQIHQL